MSVVQQSIQKLQTENTNLKKDLNNLQNEKQKDSTEDRIHRLEKEIDEMRKNNKVEISKLREEMQRALE